MTPEEQAIRERHAEAVWERDTLDGWERVRTGECVTDEGGVVGRCDTLRALALLDAARADAERLAEALQEWSDAREAVFGHIEHGTGNIPQAFIDRKRDSIRLLSLTLLEHREPRP